MRQLFFRLDPHLKLYFDGLLRREENSGALYILDDELGDRASCCTTAAVASFYAQDWLLRGGDGADIARELAKDVRRRQLPGGGYSQPYYVKQGEEPPIDIAEVGAAADSLYYVYRTTGSPEAKQSLVRSAEYLLTQVAKQNPGVVLKRPGEDFDVLNGDMYAAHTFGRAYELTGEAVFLQKVEDVFVHLMNRFGRHAAGWWPYIERWDGSVVMGNSVLYQATIVGLGATVAPLLPAERRAAWSRVSEEAVDTMIEAIRQPPSEETEAPWWTRDWTLGWELYMALWRCGTRPEIRELGRKRFAEVADDVSARGMALFRPNIRHEEPDRTPVTTTFRKAAGFAGTMAALAFEAAAEEA
ncbi:MAG: hypothetical protein E6230_02780 [Paenibacillus dendritiformis]|uniref:hypothetical protein n=1 Tax=Paenibacillus dendritiformis TaxID=130049 RepID=UPI001B046A03|nr:hypothetical protein [Paenibacillus dendritiformis]MDU5141098.1 hypothetical protein [Paenibacillus dendritiformis]GIO75027.1 hypothetical protein J27TS7_45410 [Paenibacillus dendritiformis]